MGLIEVAGLSRPKPGEATSGDAWFHHATETATFIAVVDGLGHGAEATRAANLAVAFLREQLRNDEEPVRLDLLARGLHRELRHGRGAVAALAWIDPRADEIRYVGIGNVEVCLIADLPSRLFSRPGLVGGPRPIHPDVQRTSFSPRSLLVLHTDGVGPIPAQTIPRLGTCAEIARSLLAGWARPDDDATVVVARRGGGTR